MREKMFVAILILCSAIPTLIAGGLSKDVPTVVNLMIDADITPSPTMDDVNVYYRHLINLSDVIESKHLNATIFTTSEMATADRIGITRMQSLDNYEIAMHGNATGENLSAMRRDDQESLLKKEIGFVNNCFICGGKEPDVKGFRPQLFEQNNDTFDLLEGNGFVYDAGFKAGVLYLKGHENDVWPYLIPGHKLYAVPVSTYTLSGENVYLYDRYLRDDKGITADQWYGVLTGKFDEASGKGQPMVVIFSNAISGNGDYLGAFKKFINYAVSENATFVTTRQLVNMTKDRETGIAPASGKKPDENKTCPECDSLKRSVASGPMVSISVSTPPGNQSQSSNPGNETKKQ